MLSAAASGFKESAERTTSNPKTLSRPSQIISEPPHNKARSRYEVTVAEAVRQKQLLTAALSIAAKSMASTRLIMICRICSRRTGLIQIMTP